MEEKRLSPEEVAGIISTKEVLEKIGQGRLINVKSLCECPGISRKRAYEYHREREKRAREEQGFREPSARSQERERELTALKKRLDRLEIENGALKIAQMAVEDLKKRDFRPDWGAYQSYGGKLSQGKGTNGSCPG